MRSKDGNEFRCSKKYLNAFGQLYGKGVPQSTDAVKPTQKAKVKSNLPTEDHEQIRLVQWMEDKNIFNYHIPNGGYRTRHGGFKMKLAGLRKGMPDICIPIPSKGKHSLYIELKRVKGGILSSDQKNVLERLNSLGHMAVVCNGCDEAIKVIQDYLG